MEHGAYLVSVVRPGGPFEGASLLVEGKVLYVYIATAAEDTVAQPNDLARVTDDHVRIDDRRAVLRICTVTVSKYSKVHDECAYVDRTVFA